MRLSSDGQSAVTGSDDNTAILWNLKTGQAARTLNGHTESIHAVTFSPDDLSVLTGSSDHTAVLWDRNTGKPIRSLGGHANSVESVAFRSDGRHVLTGSADGTARLWDLATGDELGRIMSFSAGKDWLVVTPEGLFDGSAGGRQAVRYRVGGRLTVVPVDRFFQDFYRPGLLAELWGGQRPMPEANFARTRPPELRMVSPRAGSSEWSTSSRRSRQWIREEEFWALHCPITERILPHDTGLDGKTTRRRYTVSLIEGTNRLRATAASGDGSWESEPVEVVLTYEKPLPRSELYLVAVGINHYADTGLNLNFAAKDADAFAELFRRRGGRLYEQVHVTELTDARATRSGIAETLREIAKQTRPQDTLVLFMAGHGVMVGQRYYFVPHDLRRRAESLDEDIRRRACRWTYSPTPWARPRR